MNKRILCLLLAVIIAAAAITGCGSKSGSSSRGEKVDTAVAQEEKAQHYGLEENSVEVNGMDQSGSTGAAPKEAPKAGESVDKDRGSAIVGTGDAPQPVSNAILSQRKMIRSANISVEVEDFDKAYGQVKSMISTYGFVQESNVKKQKTSKGDAVTSGIIVIRVDKDKFDEVLAGIKGIGDFIDEIIKGDDVTDKYFDMESRLRLLRFEEGRLEAYLKKVEDPDIIFKTESRLTEIRHEIESYTGTLNKWNDLVALSTITINIYEKSDLSNNIPVVKTYSSRLAETFSESMKGVANFFGELLIFLVAAFPVLVILGILGWIGLIIFKRVSRKREGGASGLKDDGQNE